MIGRRASWKFFAISAAFIIIVYGTSFWLLRADQRRVHADELARRVLSEARLVRDAVEPLWPRVDERALAAFARTLGESGARLAVVSADAALRSGCADENGARELLAYPEVQRALLTGWHAGLRVGRSEEETCAAAAVRVGSDAGVMGVVWLTRPVGQAWAQGATLARYLAVAGGTALLATLVVVAILLRERRRLMLHLIDGTRRLSAGDLSTPVRVAGSDELAVLSAALNSLRRGLAAHVETIDRQRRMLESLVERLHEGVIVADARGRIVLINPAAARLLNLDGGGRGVDEFIGRPVETCIRQNVVQELLLGTAREAGPTDGTEVRPDDDGPDATVAFEVESPGGTTHLLARAARLPPMGAAGGVREAGAGRVVAMIDVTQLQRAIQMRTDFVANASHELRTPLATIRAAVEALRGMDLAAERETAARFLEKVDRHASRLERMVADLLDLSRLESGAEGFAPEVLRVADVLHELRGRFEEALERKGLRFEADAGPPDEPSIVANPHLLRLILDNLVENAIKFTDAGGRVSVRVRREGGTVEIAVRDNGCGIPPEEQQRVFERFYQVRRDRAGDEQRGTGLGLSIVRHAAAALRGDVRLQSAAGEGTCVTVRVPQPASIPAARD